MSVMTSPRDTVREDPTASWHYMDNAGQLQGPFSTECMLSWAHQGWFPHTTLVFAEADEQGAGRRIDAVPELWPPQQEVPSKVLAGNSDIMTTVLKEIQTWGNSCNPREADGEEMLLENLSALSLDGTTRRGNKRVPARAKSNTLTRAQAGKEAWQNFQKTHSSGGGEGEVGEMAHQPHRPPVSFKILGGERCKASRSPDVLPRESSRPNKHLSAASGAKNAVSTDQAPFHGADPDVLVCKKRLLYAIVDTNTWIDEALHLCSKSPGREGKEEVSMVGISKDAFLQGLATTEVKIVVPSQVVRELDGLKSQKELEHGHNRIGMVASVSETAMRARRVIAALRQAAKLGVYTPSRHSEQREGSVGLWSDNTPCAPFIVMEAPDRDERERRHSSQELMKADSRILACALDMRARLQRQAAEVSGKPPSAGVACDVVLVTQDVNLQLLAAVASEGVPMRALSMTELRQELQERETVWRRAYSQQLARCAVAAAVCARSTFSLA